MMTSCGWGRTEGQIGFSGWTTSVYPEAINMQEGPIMHSLGDFLIPVDFRNSLESEILWNFHCFQRQLAPKCSHAVVYPEAFAFVIEGKTMSFVPSL